MLVWLIIQSNVRDITINIQFQLFNEIGSKWEMWFNLQNKVTANLYYKPQDIAKARYKSIWKGLYKFFLFSILAKDLKIEIKLTVKSNSDKSNSMCKQKIFIHPCSEYKKKTPQQG